MLGYYNKQSSEVIISPFFVSHVLVHNKDPGQKSSLTFCSIIFSSLFIDTIVNLLSALAKNNFVESGLFKVWLCGSFSKRFRLQYYAIGIFFNSLI